MTHDINSDPEIWELREFHGDRAALVWLEMLSIADRNSGVVGPASDQTRNQLASKCRTSRVKAGLILDWCRVKGWTISDSHLRIAKWRKYNKMRDVDESLSDSETTPTPTPTPRLTPKKIREDMSFEAKDSTWPCPKLLIEKYNTETPDESPAVEKITPARIVKAKTYLKIFPDEEFWTGVFSEIKVSSFLRGLRQSNGHAFCADFDWLLTKGKDGTENAVKVFEGKYRNG